MLQASTPVINIADLVTQLGSAISPADILTMVGVIVGAGFGFVLIWFGARKLIAAVQNAMKSGKLKL